MPLQDTKRSLCTDISTFIRERILVATCAVADGFQSIIEPGDCLMVFGKSTAVLRALLEVCSAMHALVVYIHSAMYMYVYVYLYIMSLCVSMCAIPVCI